MKNQKLCGFDINGWRDFTARNWRAVPGEEEEIGPTTIIQSGPLSSVVFSGDEKLGIWIGGPQADLAPHGLGGGWGEIGRQERRVSVRSMLERRDPDLDRLASAFKGSAQGAAFNVVSIDEGLGGGDEVQEHLLGALAKGKFRNSTLVWRPVLAALCAIEKGLISEGQRVGIVCHNDAGLSVQKLLMRSSRGVLAPERREAALQLHCALGYEHLVRSAREAAIGEAGFSARTAHRAVARSIGRAALGLACRPEVLRMHNSDWDTLDLSSVDVAELAEGPETAPDLSDCDFVLLETLAEGRLKERIAASVKSREPVIALPTNAVACGALVAAGRASRGEPIYFDFLPRLSTIVFAATGPTSFDLVRPDETLEAGRTYRSPEPASLAIPAGQKTVSVYLRKEAAEHPRKATVTLGEPLHDQSRVSLWVEQKPVSGRARMFMEARDLGRNFTVDWDEAEEDPRAWSEIIDSLAPRASIPNRLVLPCAVHAWQENNRAPGLFDLLDREVDRDRPDWNALAAKLAMRPAGAYCISSDGDLPSELGQADIKRLDRLTEKALETNRRRLHGTELDEVAGNDALKFLTWQFRRCPEEVADWLIDCIQKGSRTHPFTRHHASWKLIFQGLGRIIGDKAQEKRAVAHLLSSQIEDWVWERESACMAFLLSRSATAPLLLDRRHVERLVQRTIADFRMNLGTKYTRFHYAPFLIAGLLRWRLKEPMALVAGIDPLAAVLLEVITEAEKDLKGVREPEPKLARRRDKYLPILHDLKAELIGEGANPDLLLDIYSAGGG
ncbi:hypothetical protein [Phaeobacter sp. J2-8]|uniref:hypothetical protein n=1 Tax=Phaeobacter sp. J2-8 TaxID=2931394 RepID=UPI001FD60BA7|nr:hypothetical protein [Phaeobacter sp. J2-8]MCJ7872103.1 hypothetical protein [Phaeobacter sp. J2-8]